MDIKDKVRELYNFKSSTSVAKELGIGVSTVSKIVKKLEADGYKPYYHGSAKTFYTNLETFKGAKFQDLEIDSSFGFYISGFVDGEGSFGIYPSYKKCADTHKAKFSISIREDDLDILNQMKDMLKVGNITRTVRKKQCNEKPKVTWEVSSLPELYFVIIPFFEAFPLRAKKRKDFEVWRRAILGLEVDYFKYKELMELAHVELKEVRSYELQTTGIQERKEAGIQSDKVTRGRSGQSTKTRVIVRKS